MKSAVETITETANKAAKAASGGDTSIGNVVNANAAGAGAGAADASSVQGIAKGMKAIVDAAEATAGKAAGKEKKELLKAASDGNATGTGNADAGHLFSGAADQGASDAHAQKAAGAINAVSGEQILKEIVDAAGKNGDGAAGAGAAADQANNPISAAIGADQGNGAFGNGGMNQNSKVAAAIVLRGMAKNGKFAVANDAHANHKDGVKSAVEGDC
nr:variable large family protein [Borreliella mayonii]